MNITSLQPSSLWQNFAALNAVPRPSKKEERVIQFMKSFGASLKLPTLVDEAGNVIISKPATAGYEGKPTLVLQSHLDMVHQKNADTNFDFDTQGIDMFVEGDWVKARGTTLGADNGIGVAAIMAILQSSDIPHPPIQALFTIDEETGMTGALALKGGILKGKILLNLDTEEDTDLTIGCAGGVDITGSGDYKSSPAKYTKRFTVSITGLTGGHSGMDIHKGRANANKLMARLLLPLLKDNLIELSSFKGGSLRNAIPREAFAELTCNDASYATLVEVAKAYETLLQTEFASTDPAIQVRLAESKSAAEIVENTFAINFIKSLYACPNGIFRLSPDIAGLVQTSNNLAKVELAEGKYQVQCLGRSSVDSEKRDLQTAIASALELCGATVVSSGSYPGWAPQPGSDLVKFMSALYLEKFKQEAHVSAVHAGLECGILGTNYPDMQMISFGPNIFGAHSPDERAQISSVQKFWDYLLAILQTIK
jgi:dipeptidase D